MATKRTSPGTARRKPPTRTPARSAPARAALPAPATPAPTDEVTLVYRGGADLWFRAKGIKRRARRGEAFTVDAATAEILKRDPAVTEARPAPVAEGGDADKAPADDPAASSAGEAGPPPTDEHTPTADDRGTSSADGQGPTGDEAGPPVSASGPVTIADLPPSARIAREGI